MLTLVEELEDGPLGDEAYQGNPEGSDEQGHPEAGASTPEEVGDGEGEEGPDHIEGAVGHVRDAQHPQDEGEARGHDKEDDRPAQADEDLA